MVCPISKNRPGRGLPKSQNRSEVTYTAIVLIRNYTYNISYYYSTFQCEFIRDTKLKMPSCAAYDCTNRDDRGNREKGITFHRFPHCNLDRLRRWVANTRRLNWTPTARSHLCSTHFTHDSFDKTGRLVRLRPSAIPTIFAFPSHLQKVTVSRKAPAARATLEETEVIQPLRQACTKPSLPQPKPAPPRPKWEDHSYAIMESPRKLKRKLDSTVEQLQKCKKKLKVQQQKSRRFKRKVTSLQAMISSLQDENKISANCATQLEATLTGVPKEVMSGIINRKRKKGCRSYPKELKSFAMTLHFYSAKAYNYVRDTFELALPHPRQIRAWYSGIDAGPGFTQPAFAALEARACDNNSKGKETVCSVMLDEMAIRKHVEYAGGRFHGYVDFGNGTSDDSTPVAKDALVLMVVSVNESWKIPIGYFLIDGLSGQERASIIQQCFYKLHDVGVRAVSLTCDGPSCHFTMMRHLGATMDVHNMDPSFPHPADPQKRVHVVLDVCHMLKLLRNAFADGGLFKTHDGKTIRWEYIEELNKLQEQQGLRLGNKVKSAHIQWRKQKMKVNLAAQVFSSSVADALEFCEEELNLPQFRGCAATIQFLRRIDAVFDVLNSRNPIAKGYKAPMRETNKDRWSKILTDASELLLNLKDGAGKPMHEGPRKTAFIGFLASIHSTRKLFDELVGCPIPSMTYLLTYRFSQDHLELFFAAVRSSGGFNNNPTARQFEGTYKRLLMRHQVKNGGGNCAILDNTNILSVQNITSTISIAKKYDLLDRLPSDVDHDYADCPNFETLSPYKEAAVSYIAGYVVRMMKKKIICMDCTTALTDPDGSCHKFVSMKDRGGLQRASQSIIVTCLETEKCFQRMMKATHGEPPQGLGVSSAISMAVLNNTSHMNLFQELHSHQFDTTVEDNHVHNLVRMAASCYSRIKLFHLGKRKTEQITGQKVRKEMSKLILFKHQ